MSHYSDAELESLLGKTESDQVERNEAWGGSAHTKGRQAVCAFANDLPNHGTPGVLIVGAKDDGTPANERIDDQLLQTLSDIKTDGKIVPPPTLTVGKECSTGLSWLLQQSGQRIHLPFAMREEFGFAWALGAIWPPPKMSAS